MPDRSHASAHLPSHTASLPATPPAKGEGRGERAMAVALWDITAATTGLVNWANDNAPLLRFVGQWQGHVPMDADPNPMPPYGWSLILRRTR